ncbi:hypothetical protein EMIT051CA3_20422 [Pseudomonas chlororaphis]
MSESLSYLYDSGALIRNAAILGGVSFAGVAARHSLEDPYSVVCSQLAIIRWPSHIAAEQGSHEHKLH